MDRYKTYQEVRREYLLEDASIEVHNYLWCRDAEYLEDKFNLPELVNMFEHYECKDISAEATWDYVLEKYLLDNPELADEIEEVAK